MRQAIVTLGTDGIRDYVQMSDGQRLLLGPVTVLKFVTETTPLRFARQVLNTFNSTGTAVATVDLDAMDKLLKPHVARWSSANTITDPLIHRANRTPTSTRVQIMSDAKNLLERLGKIEGVLTLLEKRAQESLIAPKLHEELRGLVGGLHFYDPGDQGKNNAWYISGPPKVDTADGAQKLPASATVGGASGKVEEAGKASTTPVNAPAPSTTPVYAPGSKSASEAAPANVPSYEHLKSNTVLAEQVLESVETTGQKIDALVTAGRKFNASKAKEDLYAIASKATEILNNVDLAQPWVRNDLSALASEANRIQALFASAKA